jgi:GntR family transcriptional regulator/MocR family aminotransferase
VLIEAIHKLLPTHVLIEGTASGLHIVVWLEDLQINHEPPLIACARALGLGIWSITPLYSAGNKFRRKHCAGLVMGYAGLTPADIIKGVERLAKAVQQTHSRAVGNKVSSPPRSKSG